MILLLTIGSSRATILTIEAAITRRETKGETTMATVNQIVTAYVKTQEGIDGKLYFCVFVPSPVVPEGICQGEFLTLKEAMQDLQNWF